MLLFYIFFCIVFYTSPLFSTEYTYPVASLLDDATILYIHQISPENIQLFSYNTITNQSEQIVWSVFNPAGVQLLPHNKGFSFIDNGRLRIKAFHKRSPKTVDFDEPIFNINGLYWIDEHTGYCSAYYNNHYSILELTDEGAIHHLMEKDNVDCMYPQKINDRLFYIERYVNHTGNNYAIMHMRYRYDSTSELVLNFNNNPIIFLQMTSDTEGFVVQHQKDIDNKALKSAFQYHRIGKENNNWYSHLLFSFEIPTSLFLYNNDQRLFESILPLLPRMINDKIYFVDCSDKNLEPYYYDIATKERYKINIGKPQGHIFVPIQCGATLFFGGEKGDNIPFARFLT